MSVSVPQRLEALRDELRELERGGWLPEGLRARAARVRRQIAMLTEDQRAGAQTNKKEL